MKLSSIINKALIMKNRISVLILVTIVSLLLGCRKEEMLSYDLTSAVTIYKPGITTGRDSITVSFAIMDDTKMSDTVTLPIRIIGLPKSYDRVVPYSVLQDESTADISNYDLLPAVIPANSYTGEIKIKVNRTTALKTQEARLAISLNESSEFKMGPKEQANYIIRMNDFLTKPASWHNIRFGDYSQTKYRLIIRETGYFDFTGLLPEVLLFITGKCRNVLTEYLQINGREMLDENQVPVRFP